MVSISAYQSSGSLLLDFSLQFLKSSKSSSRSSSSSVPYFFVSTSNMSFGLSLQFFSFLRSPSLTLTMISSAAAKLLFLSLVSLASSPFNTLLVVSSGSLIYCVSFASSSSCVFTVTSFKRYLSNPFELAVDIIFCFQIGNFFLLTNLYTFVFSSELLLSLDMLLVPMYLCPYNLITR